MIYTIDRMSFMFESLVWDNLLSPDNFLLRPQKNKY